MKRARKKSKHPQPRAQQNRWFVPALCLGLITLTWAVFGPTIGFGFFNYDDSFYVYQNPSISNGFTQTGLVRAFTHPLVGNWHPLTSISLMLDAQMFGLNAGGYHFVNVLLHSVAVLLLFFVLRSMTGAVWRSAMVAAIFAIHPLRAESVVWISERKDVLSGVFFFLALGAYCRYAKKPSVAGYVTVAAAFTLGLLSKAMLVTLPFLLLILDYWPLGRFAFSPVTGPRNGQPRSSLWLVAEKVPLLALAIAISVATIFAQEQALNAAQDWPMRWRLDNAVVTIWVYLRQMFWPAHLAVFYPHPKGSLALPWVLLSFVTLLGVTVGAFLWRKKYPYLITGWLWYLGMLVPVIGLIQVGWQAHADRYTYLPQVGVYLAIVWAISDLSADWRSRRVVLGSASALLFALLMMLSWRQVSYWSSSIRLWAHTLSVTSNNDVAERGLGTALLSVGRVDEAIEHDRAALRIRPGDPNGLTNLANALLRKKEYPEAIERFREVIRVRPNDSEMRRNLGKAFYQSGAVAEGMEEFRAALRIRPGDSDAAYSLGNAYLEQGDAKSATPLFRQAIESNPKNVAAHYNLAIALQRDQQPAPAIAEFWETLRLDPRHIDGRNNLAIALLKEGDSAAAIAQWKAALQIQPDNGEMHNNLAVALLAQQRIPEAMAEWRETLRLQPGKLGPQISLAWILATAPDAATRDGNAALELAREAFRAAADRNLMVFRVLAAAFAESGKFEAAGKSAAEGAERAQAQGQPEVAALLEGDLELYRKKIPLRDPTYGRGRATDSAP
ncbi:MAG: tetratricopeptide repeat protein [Spartobacteria bacterium]